MPLLVLIGVYSVSILGLVLIPGQDDQGMPWRMNFFHAFYFVSFMGSTIGFGSANQDAFYLPHHHSRLNSRLICGIVGYHNDYLESGWWKMGTFSFGLRHES